MKKTSIVAVAAICAVVLSGCGLPPTQSTPTNTNTESKPQPAVSSSIETSSSNPTEEIKYHVGDTIKTKNFEIIVNSVEAKSEIPNGNYTKFKPDEGNKYLTVNLTVKNVSKESATFLPYVGMTKDLHAKIMYQDYEYSGTNLLGYSEDLHNSHLNPLSSKTGVIVFSVPSDIAAKPDELTLLFTENDTSLPVICG